MDLVNLHIFWHVFGKIWNGLTLLVIPNKSRCRFMQNFCEREGSCGGLILVEYLLCIFLVSFWSWCTYAAANVISFGCLFSSCPSSCCLLYLCCLLAGYVLPLLFFFLSFIFWKITTVKIFQKITTIKSSRRLVMWRACSVFFLFRFFMWRAKYWFIENVEDNK